jgi:hypothetical protein
MGRNVTCLGIQSGSSTSFPLVCLQFWPILKNGTLSKSRRQLRDFTRFHVIFEKKLPAEEEVPSFSRCEGLSQGLYWILDTRRSARNQEED